MAAGDTATSRAERWAAWALVLTVLVAVVLVTRHLRPYVHAQGIDDFGLLGWMPDLDLFNVSRVFDPGDLLAAVLGAALAWCFHRAVWARRFRPRGAVPAEVVSSP